MSRITLNQLPEPIKRGQVHPKDYWNDEYFKKLEPLVAALKENVPDAKYDGKALVFLLVQLLHFQEAALGKEAMPPKPCPKLPIKLLSNPAVGGPLHAVALKVFDIRQQRKLKALEWQNPGKRKECMEVFQVLRRELERRELLVVPKVHISPSCGNEVQRLREYVRRLQGQLAESPDESGVTHIVYPFGSKGDPDDGKEYTTLLAVKGLKARVHYWYTPDSYDTWINLSAVENKEVVPDRSPPGGVWKVTPRWIIDSEKFNEWMNPADYTTAEMDAEMDAAEAADRGTKRSGPSLTGQAKKARGDGTLEVAPEPVEVLGPTARVRQVLVPHRGMMDAAGQSVENLSMGQMNTHLAAYQPQLPPQAAPPPPPAAAAAADLDAAADAYAAADADPSQQQQQQQDGPAAGRPPPAPSRGSGPHAPRAVVGAAAAWFKPNAIHPMERAAMPEFFNGRNAENGVRLYRQYRDAMLSLYWENTERDLTLSDVRQHIEGEVNGLNRIFEFLQSWGLINCRTGPGPQELPLHLGLGPGVSGRMPSGTSSLYRFKRPSQLEATSAAQAGGPYGKAAEAAAAGDGSRLLHPVAGRKGSEEGLNSSCLARIYCSAMPWVDCTRLRYHCTKLPDVNLCPQAFAAGRFPSGVSSKDFVRIDDSKRHNSTDGWTPEETMLLLEGVELYKEDWEKIASHVGKSQSACLTHFVRLPIEDPYIDDLLHWTDTLRRGQQQQQLPLAFLEEPNPLLSTLGTLSNILGTRVAAAAAQKALQVLAERDLEAGSVINPEVRLAAVLAAAKQGAAALSAAAAANGHEGNANGVVDQDMQGADGPDQQQQQQDVDEQQPVDKPLVVSAVAAGLAAAATRAKQLAVSEEREIQRLMVVLVHDAARRVDARVNLLMQLLDPPGLDRERSVVEGSIKPLQAEQGSVSGQVTSARARKQQQEEAAAAAAKQKSEALKKQQADAAARQKAAAAAAAQQQQQQAAAGGAGPKQQQHPPEQPQPAAAAAAARPGGPTALGPAPGSTAAAAVAANGPAGRPGVPLQQQQQQQQQQQLSQQQQLQEQPTPGKSNASMGSQGGAGEESGAFGEGSDDLGDLLDDMEGDEGLVLEGLGDDDEGDDDDMDMP